MTGEYFQEVVAMWGDVELMCMDFMRWSYRDGVKLFQRTDGWWFNIGREPYVLLRWAD